MLRSRDSIHVYVSIDDDDDDDDHCAFMFEIAFLVPSILPLPLLGLVQLLALLLLLQRPMKRRHLVVC